MENPVIDWTEDVDEAGFEDLLDELDETDGSGDPIRND